MGLMMNQGPFAQHRTKKDNGDMISKKFIQKIFNFCKNKNMYTNQHDYVKK